MVKGASKEKMMSILLDCAHISHTCMTYIDLVLMRFLVLTLSLRYSKKKTLLVLDLRFPHASFLLCVLGGGHTHLNASIGPFGTASWAASRVASQLQQPNGQLSAQLSGQLLWKLALTELSTWWSCKNMTLPRSWSCLWNCFLKNSSIGEAELCQTGPMYMVVYFPNNVWENYHFTHNKKR
jgi:hypothetical protein